MNVFKLALLVVAVSQLSGCVVHFKQKRASHYQHEELALSSEGIEQLSADLGDGNAIIVGRDDISEIKVAADIYSAEDEIGNHDLTLVKRGNVAKLEAKHWSTNGFWINRSPSIDLTVYVPTGLNLVIEDSSGDLAISDIQGNVIIDDGSGDIELSAIGGNVDIDDNSGDIELNDVFANVTVNDGSGEIVVNDALADVSIEDGSGDIEVKNVAGTLTISDGSGDITLVNAPRLNLVETGSGDVEINNLN